MESSAASATKTIFTVERDVGEDILTIRELRNDIRFCRVTIDQLMRSYNG